MKTLIGGSTHPRAQAALVKLEAVLAHGPGRIRPPTS